MNSFLSLSALFNLTLTVTRCFLPFYSTLHWDWLPINSWHNAFLLLKLLILNMQRSLPTQLREMLSWHMQGKEDIAKQTSWVTHETLSHISGLHGGTRVLRQRPRLLNHIAHILTSCHHYVLAITVHQMPVSKRHLNFRNIKLWKESISSHKHSNYAFLLLGT